MRELKIVQHIISKHFIPLVFCPTPTNTSNRLPMKDVMDLIRQIKKGDRKALEALIVTYHRVVVCIAKYFKNNDLILGELIIKGNMGLINAVYQFDEKRGFNFISYAIWCIRHSILQSIVQNAGRKPVSLPKIGIIMKGTFLFNNKLSQYFQQEPTMQDMAGMLGFQMKIIIAAMQEDNNQLSSIDFMISGRSKNWGDRNSPKD